MSAQQRFEEPRVLHQTRWRKLVEVKVPGIGEWQYLEEKRGVQILPFTKDGSLILVRQFRIPVGRVQCELPGGYIEEHETDLEAAAREFMEETGYKAGFLQRIGEAASLAGDSSGILQLYMATDCELIRDPKRDSFEELNGMEVILLSVSDLFREETVLWEPTISHALAFARLKGLI